MGDIAVVKQAEAVFFWGRDLEQSLGACLDRGGTADGTLPPTLAEDLEEIVVAVGPERNVAFFLEIGGHFQQKLGGFVEELAVGCEQGVIGPLDHDVVVAQLINASYAEVMLVGQSFDDGV